MGNPSIPASEQLLAHGSALRAIVRSLIGDEHADDIVQDSYLATLRRGACVVEFGFAPADCAVRFSRGRKSMQLEAVPKARPVVVIVPR